MPLPRNCSGPGQLPGSPIAIEPGLPVDLLRRRPDIRQAERELAASTARIGAADRRSFPRVAVTAGAGLQGQGLGRRPQQSSYIWSVGPTAYWPLLDFGTLDAVIEIQKFRTHELLVNYSGAILNAVEEVENAIGSFNSQQQRLRDLENALAASQRAVQLAQQRYERGLTDFLNVLDAERELYVLQDQYALAQEEAIVQFIAVYKGLGGGWETYQNIPDIRNPQPAIVATVREAVAPTIRKNKFAASRQRRAIPFDGHIPDFDLPGPLPAAAQQRARQIFRIGPAFVGQDQHDLIVISSRQARPERIKITFIQGPPHRPRGIQIKKIGRHAGRFVLGAIVVVIIKWKASVVGDEDD